MFESSEQYRKIVQREVFLFETSYHVRIRDGQTGFCPRCGEGGTWDVADRGFSEVYVNSIYYSTVFNQWRCRLCDFRMYS